MFEGGKEEDGDEGGAVGEWLIERSELSFHKKLADNGGGGGGGGSVVHAGRWHGDVNIHTFADSALDLNEVHRHRHLGVLGAIQSRSDHQVVRLN